MKAKTLTPYLVGALVAQRLSEVGLSRRNEQWARERGATEYGKGHYPLFFVLHPLFLLGLLLEGRRSHAPIRLGWLALSLAAQVLRYWTISTLGRQWNTRILIVPEARRVTSGPFRYLAHPNYLAVGLEMLSLPLTVNAPKTALWGSLLNAALLLGLRIPAEDKALQGYQHKNHNSA